MRAGAPVPMLSRWRMQEQHHGALLGRERVSGCRLNAAGQAGERDGAGGRRSVLTQARLLVEKVVEVQPEIAAEIETRGIVASVVARAIGAEAGRGDLRGAGERGQKENGEVPQMFHCNPIDAEGREYYSWRERRDLGLRLAR